jgi:hypothetical protein
VQSTWDYAGIKWNEKCERTWMNPHFLENKGGNDKSETGGWRWTRAGEDVHVARVESDIKCCRQGETRELGLED